jgi:hypothetical protein
MVHAMGILLTLQMIFDCTLALTSNATEFIKFSLMMVMLNVRPELFLSSSCHWRRMREAY